MMKINLQKNEAPTVKLFNSGRKKLIWIVSCYGHTSVTYVEIYTFFSIIIMWICVVKLVQSIWTMQYIVLFSKLCSLTSNYNCPFVCTRKEFSIIYLWAVFFGWMEPFFSGSIVVVFCFCYLVFDNLVKLKYQCEECGWMQLNKFLWYKLTQLAIPSASPQGVRPAFKIDNLIFSADWDDLIFNEFRSKECVYTFIGSRFEAVLLCYCTTW